MREKSFNLHKILDKRDLTDSTFVLRLERNGLEFEAGQHLQVGPPNGIHVREYSVYNAPKEDYVEILVREVDDRLVTPVLKKLHKDDHVVVNDAVGYFVIEKEKIAEKSFLFVASGTGISPFHSFVHAYPEMNYKLLHGVRKLEEAYDKDVYESSRYVSCVSGEEGGDFHGRVTHWLEKNPVSPDTLCYICGNCDMIYDVYDILEKQGVKSSNIFTEVYF